MVYVARFSSFRRNDHMRLCVVMDVLQFPIEAISIAVAG